MTFSLDRDEQEELLAISYSSLRSASEGRDLPPPSSRRSSLLTPRGVFVSLYAGNALRGCIGSLAPRDPLHLAVRNMTIAAATRDPRFPPVRVDELALVSVEISVLGPTAKVCDVGEIEVGRDGLALTVGPRSGLLLPQVPVQLGWDRDTFLTMLCRKAGLADEAWKHPEAILERFQAFVFSDRAN